MPRWMRLVVMVALVVPALVAAAPAQAGQAGTPSAQEQAANALLQQSDWAKAVAAFQALTESEPANPRAWFGLNLAFHGAGRYDEALAALPKARDAGYPNGAQLSFRAARAWARKGDAGKAFEYLTATVKGGWTNEASLSVEDLASLRTDPRFAGIIEGVKRNAAPCEYDPNMRAFDFWIGEWDVQQTGRPRAPQGSTSRIEKSLDGCLIIENWEPGVPPTGKSFNTWNRVLGKWEQFWVDSRGQVTHYRGTFQPDGSLLYESTENAGAVWLRMTFFNVGPNEVRQFGQHSTDGGKTWQVRYDLTYIRKTPR